MKSVMIQLSTAQQAKLRNGHSVRVLPKMVGSGSAVIIDPIQYDNLNKNMKRNKGMMVSLSPELIQHNMEGGSLLGGLKKVGKAVKQGYKSVPEPIKEEIRKSVRSGAKKAVKYSLAGTEALLMSNYYSAPIGAVGAMAYDALDGEKKVNRFIDKQVKKSGLGLRVGKGLRLSDGEGMRLGAGMTLGNGMSLGGSCEFCGHGNEQFLLESQNMGKKINKKSTKVQM